MKIGEHLREMRKSRHFTLQHIAERSGYSISYLSDIEHGRTTPSLICLSAIASVYKLSLDDLFRTTSFDLAPRELALVEAYRRGDLRAVLDHMLVRLDELGKGAS